MLLSKIRGKVNYFIAHRFVKDFAILQVGNVLGNITQAVVGIILVRVLQPELYGIYALSFSLAGLISIFLGIGAQDAVTTILGSAYAKKDGEQIKEALAFLMKVTIWTGAVAFLGAIAAPLIANAMYGDFRIGIYAGIVVLASVVSTTLYSFITIILQIVGRMKARTVVGLADQLLRTLLALAFALMGAGVLGIAIGHFTGAIIVFLISAFLWRSVKREFPIMPSIRSTFGHMRHVSIRRYLRFSFWIAVDRNLSNLYNILPIFLTGVYVIPGEITYFKLAFGYLNLALSFLGPIGTLLNVEFPKMNIMGRERLAKNFVRISLYSFAMSTGISALVILISPVVFKILYGDQFLGSIPYVYGLFIYGSIMGLGIGLGSILRALNKVSFSVKLHIITLATGIPLGLLAIKMWGLWGSVALVTSWYFLIHTIAFFYVLKLLKTHDTEIVYTNAE